MKNKEILCDGCFRDIYLDIYRYIFRYIYIFITKVMFIIFYIWWFKILISKPYFNA